MRSDWIYLLLLSAGSAWSAQVYRVVDADGNVTYSDRPDSRNAETIFINTSIATGAVASSATADNAPAEEGVIDEEGVTDEEGEIDENVYAEPTAEEIAAERRETCGIARERRERYNIAHRIYRETEDGEREYLNDTELDATRAQAAADVEEWCD
jgi:hypothetical protein